MQRLCLLSWISRAGRLNDGAAITQPTGTSPALEVVAPLFNLLLSHDTPEWELVPPAEIYSPSAPFRYAIQPHHLLIHSELVVLSYFQQIYICHTSPHFCKVKVCKFS